MGFIPVEEAVRIAGVAALGLILLKITAFLSPKIKKYIKKTETLWDNMVFEVSKRVIQFFIVAFVFYYIKIEINVSLVTTLLDIVLIFLGAYFAAQVATFVFQSLQEEIVEKTRTKLDDLAFPMLEKVSKIAAYVVAALISINRLGYDITALLAGMGIAGIAVSLAAKDSISNSIAGLFLMLDRPFLPGDRIELWNYPPNQATWGDVVEVGLRSTTIKTTDNIHIIIPNSQLMTRDIINYTRDSSVIRIRIPVSVSYDSDLKTVKNVLISSIEGIEGTLSKPEPQVVVRTFGESSIDMELRVWIETAQKRRIIQDEINSQIKLEFEKMSIEMPYPRRDVHIKETLTYNTDDLTGPEQ
ncbi:MAG: mechanosensitive ion channel family protein [Candidatus Methanofastidiosia archaeon]